MENRLTEILSTDRVQEAHRVIWEEIKEKSTQYGKVALPIADQLIIPVYTLALAVSMLHTKEWIALYAEKVEGYSEPIIWMQKHCAAQ